MANVMSSDGALLLPTPAEGVFLATRAFREIASALEQKFFGLHAGESIRLHAAQLLSRRELELNAYPDRFPQLVAWVEPMVEGRAEPAGLAPAACLSLYAQVASSGPIANDGLLIRVTAPCHRTESVYSATRQRCFTMSELVFFGSAQQVDAFRDLVLQNAVDWLAKLQLSPVADVANDPFYGRGAELMTEHQRRLRSKVEILLPANGEARVACLSANLHGEFFSQRWDIRLGDGTHASSACFGVGLERLTLALIERHGPHATTWPSEVRSLLFDATVSNEPKGGEA